jgi:hypothetical protein
MLMPPAQGTLYTPLEEYLNQSAAYPLGYGVQGGRVQGTDGY